jgi:DNA adenine methylase
MVRSTVPTLALRDEWKTRLPQDDLEAAFQVLYLNRTSFSGNLTGGRIGGHDIGSRWNPDRLCDEIERLHDLLHGRFEMHNEDATRYLGLLVGNDDAVPYIDPPYHSVGNQLYRVSMTPEEHRALAARVHELPRWVASYDDVPEVHALYEWAVRLPVAATYTTARAKGARARRQELLIVPEGPSLAGREPSPSRGATREEPTGGSQVGTASPVR